MINYFVLPGLHRVEKKGMSIDAMLIRTAEFFNLTVDELMSKCRKRHIVEARQFFFYYGKKVEDKTLLLLGKAVGGRDHSTTIHGINSVQNLLDTDGRYRAKWAQYIEFMKPQQIAA